MILNHLHYLNRVDFPGNSVKKIPWGDRGVVESSENTVFAITFSSTRVFIKS
nr:MAG TPA: hypothetical protein [Caudoviricetes sp.]